MVNVNLWPLNNVIHQPRLFLAIWPEREEELLNTSLDFMHICSSFSCPSFRIVAKSHLPLCIRHHRGRCRDTDWNNPFRFIGDGVFDIHSIGSVWNIISFFSPQNLKQAHLWLPKCASVVGWHHQHALGCYKSALTADVYWRCGSCRAGRLWGCHLLSAPKTPAWHLTPWFMSVAF